MSEAPRRFWLDTVSVLLLLNCASTSYGQIRVDSTESYDPTEAMIEMRDGTSLYTVIFAPKDQDRPLPILLLRTPYGVDDGWPARSINTFLKELSRREYIFTFQDIRGRYKSEGTFDMLRSGRDTSNPKSVDESTDTYDTIDWLVRNVPNNNGRVGIWGASYDGWLALMATIEPHPALKAVMEEAAVGDMFLGDDFHHNGAFRLSYGFEYVFFTEFSRVDTLFRFDKYDTFEWYLDLGPLSNVNEKYFHYKLPTWNNFVSHPNYDSYWRGQSLASRLTIPVVPTMHVAGWWDQEDLYGPLKAYELLERNDTSNLNFIVVGPWNHGGWLVGSGDSLGKIKFGDSTAVYFREKVEVPWFEHYLKGSGAMDFPEALTFQTGSNKWKFYDSWPPVKSVENRKLYFKTNGRLDFARPPETGKDEFDSYVSNPAHPVPYRHRPIESTYGSGSHWYEWLVEDQRFVDSRPDVLTWKSDTLTEDLTISGDIVAHLFASTSGTDCDWIVKLIDVYPESYPAQPDMGGYQLMIADEVFRSRFRNSFERPEQIVPGQITEYSIDLHTNNHCFLKGHKIMVQVQSTWFPLIDRNPQKYVESIYEAKASDFESATQQIYRSGKCSSYIQLPIATP